MTTELTRDYILPYLSPENEREVLTLELKAGEEFYFKKNSDTEISWGEHREFVAEVGADFWNSIQEI